ncbi:hypothetical protein TD95_003545 [Thielaviopsis punctulata]|uniref:Transmembrane protein 19 n=1 Tax=Thielaviopsis punctulata TaxID=72032 RepID=A0A0F4Z6X7_9PEZI|nr:hypothetical protein TD95_003545 [Thielaviopsis punctulata]
MHLGIAVPATLLLGVRAYKHKSLTPAGIAAALLTAVIHAYHPWNLPFVLLCVFYVLGSRATKVKHNVKATLTLHSKGAPGGETPRTHVQVLANSLMASVLTLLHATQLKQRENLLLSLSGPNPTGSLCYNWPGDLLVVGIIANYAVVTADTLSSELGILSKSEPRLITSLLLRKVPRGTNGGVSLLGLVAGFGGAMAIAATSMFFLPVCGDVVSTPWTKENRGLFMLGISVWGLLGSLLDSLLGALFQRTVADVRTGKVVEGEGGVRVPVSSIGAPGAKADVEIKTKPASVSGDGKPSRVAVSGLDLLDNNDVNFLMAFIMSIGGIVAASKAWGVPLQDILQP